MRRGSSTDRSDNFERRLRETMDSELDPEMVTPNSAGAEELPSYEENFPLTRQFKQTNMRTNPRRARRGDDDQTGNR